MIPMCLSKYSDEALRYFPLDAHEDNEAALKLFCEQKFDISVLMRVGNAQELLNWQYAKMMKEHEAGLADKAGGEQEEGK